MVIEADRSNRMTWMEEVVVAVRVLRPFVLEVTFADGARGEVDLASELWGEMFEPLRDPAVFALVSVDSELGTIVWPNGADFSPEFLRESLLAHAQ